MATQKWTIETPVRHDIRLQHGYVSGRASLYVDEKIIFERPKTFPDNGFDHQFVIDNIPCIVRVRPMLLSYCYEFLPYETLPDQPTSPPRKRASTLLDVFLFCAFGIVFSIWALFLPPHKQVVSVVLAVSNIVVAVHLSVKIIRNSRKSGTPTEDSK